MSPARTAPVSDVSVVVLSMGEATIGRALGSLERQTLAPAEVLFVRDVTPFHRALNLAAARVSTPYFVQLDADMVLDPDCIELLRAAVAPNVGIAVGPLRDPLMGTVPGVKLFRRTCFAELQLRDSITQDVDFSHTLGERGWLTRYLMRYGRHPVHTFGDHRPDYTPAYTYGTYHQLGARYRHRRDLAGVRWRMGTLRRCGRPMALVARLALGHGLFSPEERDAPKRYPAADELAVARGLLEAAGKAAPRHAPAPEIDGARDAVRERFAALGRALGEAGDFGGALACLRQLAGRDVRASWLAEASLCHGLCQRGQA